MVCLVAALAAWVLNRADASFVLAALGALAWFLDLRRELNRANLEREASIIESAEQE